MDSTRNSHRLLSLNGVTSLVSAIHSPERNVNVMTLALLRHILDGRTTSRVTEEATDVSYALSATNKSCHVKILSLIKIFD